YTRAVERELNVEFTQAEALKVGLSNGKVPQNKAAAVEGALNRTLGVWMSGVELALSEFDKLDHLPHKLLLCGGGSSLELLMDKLTGGDWYTGLPFTKKPTVQNIHPDEVVGIVDKTGDVTDHTF